MPRSKGYKCDAETRKNMAAAALKRPSKLTGLYGFTQEYINEQKAKGLIWCSFCKKFGEGTRYRCDECSKKVNREAYRREHPEIRRVRRQAIRKAHPERSRKMDQKQAFKRVKTTEQEYQQLLESKGGVCAICGTNNFPAKRLAIDHDHKCCPKRGCQKCRRGLLCHPCNLFLGRIESGWALRAVAYLQKWSTVNA